MAWTAATGRDYVRPSGSYASDVTDREWTLIAPLLPTARPGGRRRTTCLRRNFELFRPELDAALGRSDRAKGGRPPYDAVMMFRVLVLQTLYTLSDDQAEYQLRDRLSFMRFLGLGLTDRVPDAKTIWAFRERLTKAGAIRRCSCALTWRSARQATSRCPARSLMRDD